MGTLNRSRTRVPAAHIPAVLAATVSLAGGFVLSIEMDWPCSQSVGGVGFGALVVSHAIAAIIG